MTGGPDAARLIGTLVDSRYRIDREIGRGGFGTVYEARHIGFDAPVAVKVLTLPDDADAERVSARVAGFLEEARLLKRLRHPSIVSALDVGLLPADAGGTRRPYLVMEWCSGPTLASWLDERGAPLSLDEAWRLFEPLLDGMAHAHAIGIVHRDLKPQNVLLEPDPASGELRPRIIDFGTAKIAARGEAPGSGATQTATTSSAFTLRYAAPEQLAGARTGPWTDVHALALIFVEMIVGEPAFGTGDDALALVDPERPTPKTFGIDVGPLENVIARALALRPADRFADAAAFGAAMRNLARAGWPGVVSPSAPIARASSPPQSTRRTSSPSHAGHVSDDLTAPPSSHTLPTESLETERAARPVAPVRRSRKWWTVAAVAAVALGTGAAGVRWAKTRSSEPRLRDMTGAELETLVARAAAKLHIGPCFTNHGPGASMTSCTGATLLLQRITFPTAPEAIAVHVNGMAYQQTSFKGAAGFAIDGNVALIVAAAPSDVDALLDDLLRGYAYDVRAEATPPPKLQRSAAARERLGVWTAKDAIASVENTGVRVTYSNPMSDPAIAVIGEGDKVATASFFARGGRDRLDAMPRPNVFASDGDALLVLTGAPELANPELLRRILDGARAEIGEQPAK